jgi:hypothetical protein
VLVVLWGLAFTTFFLLGAWFVFCFDVLCLFSCRKDQMYPPEPDREEVLFFSLSNVSRLRL